MVAGSGKLTSAKVGEATVQHLLLLFPRRSGFRPMYVLRSAGTGDAFKGVVAG